MLLILLAAVVLDNLSLSLDYSSLNCGRLTLLFWRFWFDFDNASC